MEPSLEECIYACVDVMDLGYEGIVSKQTFFFFLPVTTSFFVTYAIET